MDIKRISKIKSAHIETPAETESKNKILEKARKNVSQNKNPRADLSDQEKDALANRYSHFVDELDKDGYITRSTHVVHQLKTPRPYIHLMTNNHSRALGCVGSFWSQSGYGFTCQDTALSGAITSHKDKSYVPTSPKPEDFRGFYIREESKDGKFQNSKGVKAEVWPMNPQVGDSESAYEYFECQQGLGYMNILSRRNELSSVLRVFIPDEASYEIWSIELKNESKKARNINLFCKLTWGLESYPGEYFDMRVVCRGEYHKDLNAIVAMNEDNRNTHKRTGFLMSSTKLSGFDMSMESFEGMDHSHLYPEAVIEGQCRNSLGVQPYMGLIGALQMDISLKAGESKTMHFVLGSMGPDTKHKTELGKISRKLFKAGTIDKEFATLQKSWDSMVNCFKIKTPDEEINRFYNVWSKYQAKNMARYTRALDKVGYRDLLQDLMGIITFDPEYVKSFLPQVVQYQLRDGRAIRQFAKFENAPHDERMYMDSPSWICDTVDTYIKETGDMEFLEKPIGFYNPKLKNIDMDKPSTLHEHNLLAIKTLFEFRGQFGLCRIGFGDWNDSLDNLGRGGRGVSVWLSMALVYIAKKMRRLNSFRNEGGHLRKMSEIIRTMTDNLNNYGWNDDYFSYAFNDRGDVVGGPENVEGKFHLNSNAWSIFSGVAGAKSRESEVIKHMKKVDTVFGHTLIDPPYTKKSQSVGRIADIIPGQFENGSVYTHGQSFALYAYATMNMGNDAYATLKKILPDNSLPDISTGPINQQSNFTVGKSHPDFGKQLYSGFTGSLAWTRKSIEHMIGMVPDFTYLHVNPVIPSHWKEYSMERDWRGRIYKFHVSNPDGLESGVKSIMLNGNSLDRDEESREWRIPDQGKGKSPVLVEVTMGKTE